MQKVSEVFREMFWLLQNVKGFHRGQDYRGAFALFSMQLKGNNSAIQGQWNTHETIDEIMLWKEIFTILSVYNWIKWDSAVHKEDHVGKL